MKALLLAFMTLILAAVPVSASTPQGEYERAVAIVAQFKEDLPVAIQEWQADSLQKPLVESTITHAMAQLEDVVVDDCFAEWYAFQYASVFTIYMFFYNAESADILNQPSDGFLKPAVAMTQMAGTMSPKCEGAPDV
jgi:hypothetical protein